VEEEDYFYNRFTGDLNVFPFIRVTLDFIQSRTRQRPGVAMPMSRPGQAVEVEYGVYCVNMYE
jgi:hypothetical protein